VNPAENLNRPKYRGRLAPSPTGYLHLGHAKTFWIAQERARQKDGDLVLRNEDLDRARCRPEFVQAMLEDLHWFGLQWNEGPDLNGPFTPYNQSERMDFYRSALDQLRAGGFVFPCTCSRKDILSAVAAPHAEDNEPLYPGTCRGRKEAEVAGKKFSWRFRVPDGEAIVFDDLNLGNQTFTAGRDFGDFVVWRPDDVPAYQLACTVDDSRMRITEVVRGADLLASTARQILIYRALGWQAPQFFHCELMRDEQGRRLAKRHDSLSLRQFRAQNATPETLRKHW
jgi:glutamyl-tRNA synthetase